MGNYLTGVQAEQAYLTVHVDTVFVIGCDVLFGKLCDCRESRPRLADFGDEGNVLIFPEDFAWTLGLGKEVWDRVAFTRREWVDDLDET